MLLWVCWWLNLMAAVPFSTIACATSHFPVFHALRHFHNYMVLLACVGNDEGSRDGLEYFRDHDARFARRRAVQAERVAIWHL
jgi:hypothetical protein